MGKEPITKLASFCLSTSCYSASSTCSGAASTCPTFCTIWASGSGKGPTNCMLVPFWWCTVCSSTLRAPSEYVPQVRPRPHGVAPATGDLEDMPGAVIQTSPAKCSLVCHCWCDTNCDCPMKSLSILPALLFQVATILSSLFIALYGCCYSRY